MKTTPRHGFSLIEVTLALLVISVGMLSLFSLFPAGLRENILSRADLRQAAFADYVFSRLEARAAEISGDWAKWKAPGPSMDGLNAGGIPRTVVSGDWQSMRYRLWMTPDPNNARVWTACLQSSEVEQGTFDGNPVFMTELFFTGVE